MRDYSILHIGKYYPPHPGGIENHVQDLATRQARHGSVSVIVSNNDTRTRESFVDGVRVRRVPRFGSIASMPICPGLVRAIRDTPADLVHIHTPNPGAAAAFLLSGHRGRVVITHHADTLGRRILRKLSDPFVMRLMHHASCIVATSTRYLNTSEELRPFLRKCRVIPLGIDPAHLSSVDPAAVERLRAEHGNRMVLAIGRLVPYKGFDILVRAMRHVDGTLVLIGSGPERSSLEKLARSEGVADKISICGRIDDLRPYFAAASVFALPSLTRAEAFGVVQLEAMAAGIPVINTELDSGVPEISVNGLTGITVPPRDANALAQAVQLLLDNPCLRAQLSKAARNRVLSEYTVDMMVQRTLSLYDDVIVSSNRS